MEFGNQYLTYEDYKLLGGTLDLAPFNVLELQARKEVDKYTFGRLVELEEQKPEVKICMYRLVELEDKYNREATRDAGIASESIDGYSVSYKDTSETNTTSSSAKTIEVKDLIRTMLAECRLEDGTPYLYVGV